MVRETERFELLLRSTEQALGSRASAFADLVFSEALAAHERGEDDLACGLLEELRRHIDETQGHA